MRCVWPILISCQFFCVCPIAGARCDNSDDCGIPFNCKLSPSERREYPKLGRRLVVACRLDAEPMGSVSDASSGMVSRWQQAAHNEKIRTEGKFITTLFEGEDFEYRSDIAPFRRMYYVPDSAANASTQSLSERAQTFFEKDIQDELRRMCFKKVTSEGRVSLERADEARLHPVLTLTGPGVWMPSYEYAVPMECQRAAGAAQLAMRGDSSRPVAPPSAPRRKSKPFLNLH